MFKKILLTSVVCVAFASANYGQRTYGTVTHTGFETPGLYSSGDRDVADTLRPVLAEGCATAPISINSTNGGYMAGGNGYGDREKAQYILSVDSGAIYSVLALIAAKEGGSTESYRAKIYAGASTTGPIGTAVATSLPVLYSDIDTTGGFTTFAFDPPHNYLGSFYMSLEVDQNQAFIGIAHTADSCGNSTAWEKWNSNVWYPMSSVDSWDYDLSLYLYAEVGEKVILGSEDQNLIVRGSQKVVPNPANEEAMLLFSLFKSSSVRLDIFSTTGVLVSTILAGIRSQGLNQIALHTADLATGMYVYRLYTEQGVGTGRFSVVR